MDYGDIATCDRLWEKGFAVVMITRITRKRVVGHVTDDFILLQKAKAILLF